MNTLAPRTARTLASLRAARASVAPGSPEARALRARERNLEKLARPRGAAVTFDLWLEPRDVAAAKLLAERGYTRALYDALTGDGPRYVVSEAHAWAIADAWYAGDFALLSADLRREIFESIVAKVV